MLREPALFEDPRCSNDAARVASRDWVDVKVADVFSQLKSASVSDGLTDAQTAFANLNSVHDLIQHPQLRTRTMPVGGRTDEVPATAWSVKWKATCTTLRLC